MVCSDRGRAHVEGAPVPALPEGDTSGLACYGGLEKEEQEVFAGQHRVLRHPGYVWVSPFLFAATRSGADQNQPAYRFWVAQRERLRYVASDREAENINSRLVQRLYEAGSVVC